MSEDSKYEYKAEYEIRASVKMIYPYLSTPQGLSEWFADKVEVLPDKLLHIYWDNELHTARISSQRNNVMVRYQFLEEDQTSKSKRRDANYLEFKLNYSELTDTTYLIIKDYSDEEDEEVLKELWDGLVESLREKLGA